jgi:hypothetical protein
VASAAPPCCFFLGEEDDEQVSGLGPKLGRLLGCGKKATARERKRVGLENGTKQGRVFFFPKVFSISVFPNLFCCFGNNLRIQNFLEYFKVTMDLLYI